MDAPSQRQAVPPSSPLVAPRAPPPTPETSPLGPPELDGPIVALPPATLGASQSEETKTAREARKKRSQERKQRKLVERQNLAAALIFRQQNLLRQNVSASSTSTADCMKAATEIVTAERRKERVAKKIREMMDKLVQQLTSIARLVEKWKDDEKDKLPERKKSLKDLLKKYIKRLRKLHIAIPLSAVHRCNLPLGLIKHVDGFKSPNTWLIELYTQACRQNNIARGELLALGSFQATLRHRLSFPNKQMNEPQPAEPIGWEEVAAY